MSVQRVQLTRLFNYRAFTQAISPIPLPQHTASYNLFMCKYIIYELLGIIHSVQNVVWSVVFMCTGTSDLINTPKPFSIFYPPVQFAAPFRSKSCNCALILMYSLYRIIQTSCNFQHAFIQSRLFFDWMFSTQSISHCRCLAPVACLFRWTSLHLTFWQATTAAAADDMTTYKTKLLKF